MWNEERESGERARVEEGTEVISHYYDFGICLLYVCIEFG